MSQANERSECRRRRSPANKFLAIVAERKHTACASARAFGAVCARLLYLAALRIYCNLRMSRGSERETELARETKRRGEMEGREGEKRH